MSDFVHTMRVQCILDDGTTLEMSNAYTIPGVLHVAQLNNAPGDSIDPFNIPVETEQPDFFICKSVAGFGGVGVTGASFNLWPGDVFVLPSNNGATNDTNSAATTNPTALADIQFGSGTGGNTSGNRISYMILNNTAS